MSLVLLLLVAPGAVDADPRRRMSASGYVPRAGYGRTVELTRLRRRAGIPHAEGAAEIVVDFKGRRHVPVVCLGFQNIPHAADAAEYERILFETRNDQKSMSRYFADMSGGLLEVGGEVRDWIAAPRKDTYYETLVDGRLGPRFAEWLTFGLEQTDAGVDFSRFDNDGADGRPNSGDDDGKVDVVMFIHPEVGGECGDTHTANFGSHMGNYFSSDFKTSDVFHTNDKRLDRHGRPIPDGAGGYVTITIDDYVLLPGYRCPTTGAPPEIMDVGAPCHEYAHVLRLPDLADRTPNDPDSQGLGEWCCLATGNYLSGGDRPCWLSAWCRSRLGWGRATKITRSGTYSLQPVQEGGAFYRIDVPGTNDQEFFLVEWREKKWSAPPGQTGPVNWDEFLPGSGLAVYHVDHRVGSGDRCWPNTHLDQGQNDSSPVYSPSKHYLVALEQADGLLQLEKKEKDNGNWGDGDDLFEAGGRFGPKTTPDSRAYDGTDSNIVISGIDFASRTMRVEVAPPVGTEAAGPRWQGNFDLRAIDSARPFLTGQELAPPTASVLAKADIPTLRAVLREAQLTPALIARAKTLTRALPMEPVATEVPATPSWIRALYASGAVGPHTRVQFMPGASYAEFVGGVQVPKSHVVKTIEALAGVESVDALHLVPVAERPDSWLYGITVGNRVVPVLNRRAGAVLDRDGALIQFLCDGPPSSDLEIQGELGVLSEAGARAAVARSLGLETERIEGGIEGVFLFAGQSRWARVAWCFRISLGHGVSPIEVVIDQPTRIILELH